MFLTLQITIPGPGSGLTVAKSIRDALNEARAARNVYPKVGNFCKYLLLQPGSGSFVRLAGSTEATISDAIFLEANSRFVLEDMGQGLIPLGDMYLVVGGTESQIITVALIQD